ncbi:hypothetical protein NIIDMKKI_46250 [Mycobacterium kansasii]|uniref:Uncharacterized protein n=1 Tax=Mycobacterium kansasii TaxID=1768 RepID=A0A7G1II44_MYCKA|nr:hypothetical protein NIIDMKKI_46250 [Mycobacterium kansasii]
MVDTKPILVSTTGIAVAVSAAAVPETAMESAVSSIFSIDNGDGGLGAAAIGEASPCNAAGMLESSWEWLPAAVLAAWATAPAWPARPAGLVVGGEQ